MHKAYSVHSIVKNRVDIESIAAFGDHVIVGTKGGVLISYLVDKGTGVDMKMFNKSFSKKPITQMEVVAVENLLFVLTDNMIHVCDMSREENNFEFIHSSMETKGCTMFVMDVDTPKSTTGETATFIRIGCAIKRSLVFFFWKKDKLVYLKLHIDLIDTPRDIKWVNQTVCVGYRDEYVIYDISFTPPKLLTRSTISQEPTMCLIRNNMLGISKDRYLMLIDPSKCSGTDDFVSLGMNSNPTLTTWTSSLLGLVWDEPFVIGRMKNALEIRCLVGKDTLVQSLPELKNCRCLVRSEKGTIFAGASSELWCIRMMDIPAQRVELLQQKKYQLAIELTEISDEDATDKAQTIRQIRMLYAKELFTNKEFAEAMKEFEKADIDPYDVIRLFPSLVPEPKTITDASLVPTASIHKLEDYELESAYSALTEFLAVARQRERAKLSNTKSSSHSLLEIIDTTLLKCYLQTNHLMLKPILRRGYCHLEESEKVLTKKKKLDELVTLYQVNRKHKKALTLLKDEASVEGSELDGLELSIKYLQDLGEDYLPLIFEFSDWILNENPMQGLLIFTEKLNAEENLPRAKVLDFLVSKHKALVIPYLEHIIDVWQDTNTLRHNALIKEYTKVVQRLLVQQSKGEEVPDLPKFRAKLYKMLDESQYYSPDRVLQDFPTAELLEERALILGRLKMHEKVLTIYIQVLGDVMKARAYAEANYEQDKDVFNTLLSIILKPMHQPPYEGVPMHPDFVKPNIKVALELLNVYTVKIEPIKILEYMPDNFPMQELKRYMEMVIRTELADQHQRKIMMGLLRSEATRLQSAIDKERKKCFELTESTVCHECKKRFANQTAFVRYPNGQLYHLSCYDRSLAAYQQ